MSMVTHVLPSKRGADTAAETEMRWILEGAYFAGKGIESQVAIKTRFRDYPFIADFLLGGKYIIEVHANHTAKWHTHRRESKDHTKLECLLAESWPVFDVIGSAAQIKKYQEEIKEALLEHITYNRKYTLLDLELYGLNGWVTHVEPQ